MASHTTHVFRHLAFLQLLREHLLAHSRDLVLRVIKLLAQVQYLFVHLGLQGRIIFVQLLFSRGSLGVLCILESLLQLFGLALQLFDLSAH